MSNAKQNWDFSGTWHSVYHYTSVTEPGLLDSRHEVKFIQKGETLIVESLPNKEKSYLLMHLKFGDRIATGTWEETTSPTGTYKGITYRGAVQLRLTEDGNLLHGMYVVADRRSDIKSGYWEIKRG